MKEMRSNDSFKAIHTGGVHGYFMIPLNEGLKHCVWNQDFRRWIFFESVKAANDWKRINFLSEVSFGIIGS